MDKKALYCLSYGLYIVSSRLNERINGQVANTVFQVTSEPPLIASCINKDNYTYELIAASGIFAVSVLVKETPLELIGRFGFKSGREMDKFDGYNFKRGATGAPLLYDYCIAFLEAEVKKQLDLGTHTLFCGELLDCGLINTGEPLTYAYYHQIKRGIAPRSAPIYPKEKEVDELMNGSADTGDREAKYRCTVCGYVYDPGRGDPESGIQAGTPFNDLPGSWVCPVCGAAKDYFEKEER